MSRNRRLVFVQDGIERTFSSHVPEDWNQAGKITRLDVFASRTCENVYCCPKQGCENA